VRGVNRDERVRSQEVRMLVTVAVETPRDNVLGSR